ncbi:hypothetical protein DFQ28_008731 [Apophysomyces sp. BC1034]|nr:hypothetical protein DFQ30_008480 [Apophysomyces sp. BC1015]KAG0176025.1 hypothetical protein DFQ29_006649 [Apophysomyces sp. BC1021]KAG0185821.1 hypothetical protein DFQ28_008731 [Apophysomyces sp. BC1034]
MVESMIASIYSEYNLSPIADVKKFYFIRRVMRIFAEEVFCCDGKSTVYESESAYSHYAIWPLVKASTEAAGTSLGFRPGETHLHAMTCSKNDVQYKADGVAYLRKSQLEVLLLEVSGAYDGNDRPRQVFDHIKGAFGATAMLRAILSKYCYADPKLLPKIQVLFVHARKQHTRVWSMKAKESGEVCFFERVAKTFMPVDVGDAANIVEVANFFWLLGDLLKNAVAAVEQLRLSHNEYLIQNSSVAGGAKRRRLDSLIRAQPPKPTKVSSYANMGDLDPISSPLGGSLASE